MKGSTRRIGFAEIEDTDLEVPPEIPATPVAQTPDLKQKRNQLQDQVSPATTFDSSLGSPTRTFDDSEAPTSATRHTISIDHNVKSTNGRASRGAGAGLIFGMSKPMLLGITALVLSTSGAAAYFFRSWLTIPGLNGQIERLEDQVKQLNFEIDRLSGEVDRLEGENDRYEVLNNQLNETVLELEEVSEELNATSIQLRIVSEQLNWTNQDLKDRVQDLTKENQEYERLNKALNATATSLSAEVNKFKSALSEMILENEALNKLAISLQNMTDALSNLTDVQEETLIELRSTLDEFYKENDRLENVNKDLRTIVTFLNETSSGLGENLEEITDFLANQIVANQVLVLESLENTFRQRIATWDCDYRDMFREEPFGQDYDNVVISSLDLETKILPYLETRVLSELCLDTFDFGRYVRQTYRLSGDVQGSNPPLTTNRLIRSVLLYTGTALDYFFPEGDEAGVTSEEWAAASFDCENLENSFEWGLRRYRS